MHLRATSGLLLSLLLLSLLSIFASAGYRPASLELCPGTKTAPPKNEHGKEPKNGITGDTLSVIRCYCEAPTYDRWGYYLQANYTNYHDMQSYTAQFMCSDDARSDHNIPKCWDAHKREGDEVCDDDAEDNEFCYTMTFEHQALLLSEDYMRPGDHYTFNGQAREVGSQLPNERPAPDECDDHCYYWLDGMKMARDGGDDHYKKTLQLTNHLKPKVCNRKEVYTDLDDMCWRCKKKAMQSPDLVDV